MIKAIIFDCFGVLVTSSYEPFKAKYFGTDQTAIDEFMRVEDMSSRGEISLERATREFADMIGKSYEETLSELSKNPRNVQLINLIDKELSGKWKIGFLSNVAGDRLDQLFSQSEIDLFDDIVLSYNVGLAKPDPRIFQLAADRLGVEPKQCLLVDDNKSYLTGAESIGMKTLHFVDTEEAIAEIKRLLDVANADE